MRMRILVATVLLSASPTTVFASVILDRSADTARTHLDARDSRVLFSPRTLRTSSSYLPAQIGGIVGAYGLSLVIVAALILVLSKRRREHLETGDDLDCTQQTIVQPVPVPVQTDFGPLSSPTRPYVQPSIRSWERGAPGISAFVDQEIVSADREMAQAQLEEMYKYVMEQEEAKAAGIVLEGPPPPLSPVTRAAAAAVLEVGGSSSSTDGSVADANANANAKQHRKGLSNVSTLTLQHKDKSKGKPKPQNLTLNLDGGGGKEEPRKESRTASILSALKSPRSKKKTMQGLSISSPIMTPMSGTFPRVGDGEEMNAIPPRHYTPAAPPPVPVPMPMPMPMMGSSETPPMSPLSTQSIDQRIGAVVTMTTTTTTTTTRPNLQMYTGQMYTGQMSTTTLGVERDPDSAVSQDSSAPLVGLPTSPKPGVNRFPSLSSLSSLPASPRASSFVRPGGGGGAPSAVRTGGALPLRAYEPSLTSPSFATHSQTRQTVFERTMPQTPGGGGGGAHTPWTGAPVPYSPYQPFSPVIPMTPSLVTRADRKRMKRLEPKTPTMEMVRSIDDTW